VTDNAVASTVVDSTTASDDTAAATYSLRHNPVQVDCSKISAPK